MRIRAPLYATALLAAAAPIGLLCAATSTPALAQQHDSNQQVQNGVDAWKAGDFDAAVRQWMPAANSGNADAQFNLGQAYKLGRGVLTSLADAEIWYRRAAQQGHLQAEDNLGLTLFTMGKREEAMMFIRRSAARGEARAQFLLGTAHYNGDLAEKNWPRAYALIQRASETGLSLAKSRILELDRLIPADQRKAGLDMLPDMRRTEEAARLAALPNSEAPAAPSTTAESRTEPQMIALAPEQMVSTQPSAPPLMAPQSAASTAPAAGVTFTPPPVKAAEAPAPQPANTAMPPAPTAAPLAAPTPVIPPASVTSPASAAPPAPANSAQTPAPAAPPAAATQAATKPANTAMPPASVASPASAAPSTPVTPTAPANSARTPAPAAPAVNSPWRAQLGSFSVPENARNMWAQASAKYPELHGKRPIYAVSGRYTRLLVEGFASQSQAAALCAKVRANGESCLVSSR